MKANLGCTIANVLGFGYGRGKAIKMIPVPLALLI